MQAGGLLDWVTNNSYNTSMRFCKRDAREGAVFTNYIATNGMDVLQLLCFMMGKRINGQVRAGLADGFPCR